MAGLDASDLGPRPEGDHDYVTPPGTPPEPGERFDPEECDADDLLARLDFITRENGDPKGHAAAVVVVLTFVVAVVVVVVYVKLHCGYLPSRLYPCAYVRFLR